MTLGVAASFPWGWARTAYSSPTFPFPVSNAVILLADSRWTYDGLPPEDRGQKLWPISVEAGHAIGAIIAGDVMTAEEALRSIRDNVRHIDGSPPSVASLASKDLSKVYQAHRNARPDISLHVIIGMADALGQTTMMCFDCRENFTPRFTEGVELIGWPSARDIFRERLPEIENLVRSRSNSHKPESWAMALAECLYGEVIGSGEEPFVGGRVQMAIVDGQGLREARMWDIGGRDSIKEITFRQADLKKYHRVPRLASGQFDVGFHHICD